ncbi:MAG: hypothetical protein H0T92_25365 [Pyrinomonadaceae bacterium]|nr:hypothetical protein [Pyrinomonadaceae bacterium]
MLPTRVGDFRAEGAALPHADGYDATELEGFQSLSAATRLYASPNNNKLSVTLIKTRSDSAAYALLTNEAARLRETTASQSVKTEGIGTTGVVVREHVAFFKGATFVSIVGAGGEADSALVLAQALAETIDSGTGEIPVLVKHLPEWEEAHQRAVYAVTLSKLREAAGNNSVFEVLSFEGGTEAVMTTYDSSTRLVIVEYPTPQFAADNDSRVAARLQQVREQGGQTLPSAYRRVGNYLVFVFGAPDQTAAEKLIDSVKYEQVVRWLGNNPRFLERIERSYAVRTAGMLVGAFKLAGIGLVLCSLVGSLIGGTIFMRRRAQAAVTQTFSDAGGMVRLNIDDMVVQNAEVKLLVEAESGSPIIGNKKARD